ncbi:MAG: hypothetical protein JSV91_00350 [Phycisphaerales bacterium]|nr:MAG: hypothetical protein JSV91_00350 [Phycisphaerales bacterium]
MSAGVPGGCSKNLGVPEREQLVSAVPQIYLLQNPPREVFRAVRQAVANTPQAGLIVCDEASGIITWSVSADPGQEGTGQASGRWVSAQNALKEEKAVREGAAEALRRAVPGVLTVGTDGTSWMTGQDPKFVICTALVRPEGRGSRVHLRRVWSGLGSVHAGQPHAWLYEPVVFAQAGLRPLDVADPPR